MGQGLFEGTFAIGVSHSLAPGHPPATCSSRVNFPLTKKRPLVRRGDLEMSKEKQEVQLLEKQKRTNSKVKRLKKLMQEGKAAKKQAERDSMEEIKKGGANVEEQEADLEEEEIIDEGHASYL
ncbi:hypothetical protein Agabi119p4_10728 [Agaricus bisporus var. burnettii]|uniref:Uncharacterized protein n=1 Tax=Agaricus bisporus var. burnettii TaxID=192524 RepID=A0A8H7EWN5_AGABI|nr:hypothetical protein Agabi119p4_10728 [Agaricus bisporus var. burnettii]